MDPRSYIAKVKHYKENIYLDERLIKNFDLKHSTFKGKGARNVVYIYEDEVMVGFLLPVVNVK